MPYVSEKRLYLADDGKTVVEEGDPRAATLLVGVGGTLSDEDAKRYGLADDGEKDKAKAKADAPANKAKSAPSEDKDR